MFSVKHMSWILSLLFAYICPVTAALAALSGPKESSCAQAMQAFLPNEIPNLRLQVSSRQLNDYGQIKTGADCYAEAWPGDTKDVSELVRAAYQHNIPMRINANRHSVNGSSVPRRLEWVIHTDRLNRLAFNKKGEVTVGAGIPMFLAQQYIEKMTDYTLPVTNVGGLAATVGGYISAGGISDTSDRYGGFWNHVLQITLVVADGKVVTVQRNDPLFRWLFGAMGQLGVITEAKLELIPKPGAKRFKYPAGLKKHLTYEHEDFFSKQHQPLYWFNLFVASSNIEQAKQDLSRLQSGYPGLLLSIPIYDWPVNNNKFVPPLIYPRLEDFHAVGIWGRPGEKFTQKQLLELANEFEHLVLTKHYRRYVQAELLYSPKKYRIYFGDKLYGEFFSIKKQVDPKLLFNHGSVFESKVE